jgi:hypothetical protein
LNVETSTTVAELGHYHEFHDTKHRRVNYTALATSRFREYFPAAVTADRSNLMRVSVPATLSVPSSARPPAPKPLYVIPTFGWSEQPEGDWTFRKRSGGGLRVYLDRPWFASGEGELLGAVLWTCAPLEGLRRVPVQVPEVLRPYVSQWGLDPIWDGQSLPAEAVPRREQFLNAVAYRDGVSLDELSGLPIPVSVAGHEVKYDRERQLWYCDILMDPGDAYFPFVRLALARFQPESVPDAHLSRVVLADFIQLLPDRSASVTFDPIDTTVLNLAIVGQTYDAPDSVICTVTVQTQSGGPDGAWVPVGHVTLSAFNDVGARTLWTGPITLPAPRGARPFRLLIEEFETFRTYFTGPGQQRRLVYAEVLNL